MSPFDVIPCRRFGAFVGIALAATTLVIAQTLSQNPGRNTRSPRPDDGPPTRGTDAELRAEQVTTIRIAPGDPAPEDLEIRARAREQAMVDLMKSRRHANAWKANPRPDQPPPRHPGTLPTDRRPPPKNLEEAEERRAEWQALMKVSPEALQAAAERPERQAPGLAITGSDDPRFTFREVEESVDRAIEAEATAGRARALTPLERNQRILAELERRRRLMPPPPPPPDTWPPIADETATHLSPQQPVQNP